MHSRVIVVFFKTIPQRPPHPQFYNNQPQLQPPQFVPLQRAWAAPLASDNRDPTVIAYLKDLEDYDWSYTGGRPDLERPARIFQEQVDIT